MAIAYSSITLIVVSNAAALTKMIRVRLAICLFFLDRCLFSSALIDEDYKFDEAMDDPNAKGFEYDL